MKPLWELQEKYNFHIVEDSACSAGASIDGKKVGNGRAGNITKMMIGEYTDIVMGKNDDYSHWLTPVY